MKNSKIMLGDQVRDKVTGYTGIAVARCQFLNGCIQYTVSRKLKPGQEPNPAGEPSFDEVILEVVKKKVIVSKEYELEEKKESKQLGGPITFNKGMRGY